MKNENSINYIKTVKKIDLVVETIISVYGGRLEGISTSNSKILGDILRESWDLRGVNGRDVKIILYQGYDALSVFIDGDGLHVHQCATVLEIEKIIEEHVK